MPTPDYHLTLHRGKLALTFNEGNIRRRISTGTTEPIAAAAIARRIWETLHSAKSERIEDLWIAYTKNRELAGILPARFDVTWKALGPFFGKMIGSHITEADCRAYQSRRQAQGKAASTITTELSLLRACINRHYGKAAPKIYVPPPSAPREHWLTKQEVRTLVQSASSSHVALFLTLAATTGARAQAILDLTWDRVDFGTNQINYQPAGRNITNKRRTRVPMNAALRTAMEKAYDGRLTDHVIEWNGQPVSTVKKALQRLSRKTNIHVSPHVLRHSAAVWMAQEGVDMAKISQYLGHTDLKVTMAYYAHFHPSHMKDAADATDFMVSIDS